MSSTRKGMPVQHGELENDEKLLSECLPSPHDPKESSVKVVVPVLPVKKKETHGFSYADAHIDT